MAGGMSGKRKLPRRLCFLPLTGRRYLGSSLRYGGFLSEVYTMYHAFVVSDVI